MTELCAIILAAGRGVRMNSRLPKILHPILGRPMVAYPVAAAREAGAGRVALVISDPSPELEVAAGVGVEFVRQPEPLGTADAVARARPLFGELTGTALLLCGDVPLLTPETLKALIKAHRERKALVTVLSMTPPNSTGYGRLVRDGEGNLAAIVEEKDADAATRRIAEVNTGTYAVTLPWLWSALEGVGRDNRQGEFYLTDIVALAARERGAASLKLPDHEEAQGVNSRSQLAEAAAALRGRINRYWMGEGVTLEDPSTAWIEPGVALARDVTLGPGCRLEGKTRVGQGCRIDTGAIVTDSELGENVHILPYSVVNGAVVGDRAKVGPFAHLRPAANLGEEAKVGNFVEVKKSVLGKGVKASHLSYIGDAEVGEGTNIGAGTITCNYDGVKKHRTVIGKRAFIGSNTSFVAPVSVGDDAVVGAGSTITREVGEGALGVTRAPQKNVENWKSRRSKSGEK